VPLRVAGGRFDRDVRAVIGRGAVIGVGHEGLLLWSLVALVLVHGWVGSRAGMVVFTPTHGVLVGQLAAPVPPQLPN
jgi:hypothetical protein